MLRYFEFILGMPKFSLVWFSTDFVRTVRGHSASSDVSCDISPSLLGDAPLCPTSPPIFLRHLCIFLLIVASPRQSALAAPIPESDDHVMQHSYHRFTILHLFSSFYYLSSFYYFDSDFLVYRHASHLSRALSFFLLGSPARCAFLLYLCLYICLGSPARSRLSHSAVALTVPANIP